MMLEKRHHETIFYGSNKMNTLPHAAAPAMSIITQNLRGQNNQETRRNISRLAVTSRDWRDHIRHSPTAEGSDLADYRQWLERHGPSAVCHPQVVDRRRRHLLPLATLTWHGRHRWRVH